MDEQKCQKELVKHAKIATIEDIPYEVLEKIFHQLSMYEVQQNLALVSKQFLKVSRIPGMVDNIKIIIGPGKITNVYQRKMLKNHGSSHKQHKLDFEEKKNICFDKAKAIVKVHPDAKIELLYFDHLGHETCYLFHAISEQNIEEVKFLLEHTGDAKNTKDYNGNTPLHLSAEIGNISITKILLQFEPTWINAMNDWKWTPMHYAVCNIIDLDSACQITKTLLEHGADANALDEHNKTPLHWTIVQYGTITNQVQVHNSITKARILLEHGAWASLGLKNKFGETLLESFKNMKTPVSNPIASEDKQKMINLLENYQKENKDSQ